MSFMLIRFCSANSSMRRRSSSAHARLDIAPRETALVAPPDAPGAVPDAPRARAPASNPSQAVPAEPVERRVVPLFRSDPVEFLRSLESGEFDSAHDLPLWTSGDRDMLDHLLRERHSVVGM